jgi:uroporphyrin-III C-methyltransferase/precorrin-2 dehydrogenase/sirohydrochlorin ferrochelatase
LDYLPLYFDLRDTPVLVVGGGSVALRKISLLCRAGAIVTVVSPDIDPQLQRLLRDSNGRWEQATFGQQHLGAFRLVVAATPHHAVNAQVSSRAMADNIPVNVVDDPQLCSFIFPAIVDRDPLLIAIGSGGRSPVLVRQVRARIEAMLPAAYGRLAVFLGRFRAEVQAVISGSTQRRRFWERVVNGSIAERVLQGREADADVMFRHLLLHDSQPGEGIGEVYLIGAGPGDPDLVSFRAARLLQAADVVLHDRLVSPQVLELARRDAERIYVGKQRDDHALPQPRINELLLELARQGKRVARLKGGDPFIFGRGGEELELLARNRVPFQVVPGVTAASGCACYAGIPLTHRDHAQSVRFVTGHVKNGGMDLPWEELVHPGQTLVFYMGLQGLPLICERLQKHGLAPDTPIALVEQGTTPHQRTLVGTLQDMVEQVADAQAHAPTLIIVGGVVALREQLSWYGESANPGRWPPEPG